MGDDGYLNNLQLAKRSQVRGHPVGVSFGKGKTVTGLIRARNDVPRDVREVNHDSIQVFFQGHDGVFHINCDHPDFERLSKRLGDAIIQKAVVWFVAQPDLAILDVGP